MAAPPGLLLSLLLLGPHWWDSCQLEPSTSRRFSDFKVCADEECSMLMYHGEALADFTGPDCRFVNFKKGDHVYVYYKLAGESPEVWAGSVGRIFGYFPKDLIKVLHKYTEEELYIPADETDFVCFEGGRDDFHNYNVEELLGTLELEDFTPELSEEAEEVSQNGVKSPEGTQETELDPAPEPEPAKVDLGEREGVFSESTEELQEQSSAQESHPHTNSAVDNTQGVQSPLDNFEEMLHDKLKVPGSKKRTNNSSPVSVEQETINTYNVLEAETTIDLKTKFGSTADALVSDDEATRLVTSLEDDFDEEPGAEYYPVENDEENTDSFDELPLLSFTDEEDENVLRKLGIEKYSTDENPNLIKEDNIEPPLPPGTQNDNKDILATWGDTLFSIVTGDEEKPGMVDLENSNPEEDKREDVLVSASHQRKSQSTPGYMDPEDENYDLFVEDSKSNGEKDLKTDPELVITGEEKVIQESRRGLAHHESESETLSAYQPKSSKLNPLPAAKKAKEFTLKAVFERKENDLKEPIIHISKETFHEDKSRDSIESELVHRALGSPVTENNSKRESLDASPLLGDNQPDASKDRMEVPGTSISGPKVGQWEGFHRFSSPEETRLPRELETKVPTLGNLNWQQQEKDVPVAEGREDPADVEPPQPQATQGTQEVDSLEVPSVQSPEAEDDYSLEELLEDENAVSAWQSKENNPGVHDRSDMSSQVFEKVILGSLNLDTEENKHATNMILEIGKQSDTTSEEAGGVGQASGSMVVDKEESYLADVRTQGPSEVDSFHEKMVDHTPGFGEAIQSKDPNVRQKDNPTELVGTLGLKIPGEEEISEWALEDPEELGGSESQGPDAEDLGDDPSQQATPEIPNIVLNSVKEDLPIINSFFKDHKSLYRFLKYIDIHQLEGMLQDMSIRLKSAHRNSLPYNVEKVLDKIFRAYESRILSVAENILDTRENNNRYLGTQENNVLEEAALLDDIQDLIYFVRYQYSGVKTAPLATPPPQEEVGAGPVEELQPPMKDNLPPKNTEDLSVQPPEQPGLSDQPATSVQPPEQPGLSDQPATRVQPPEQPGLSDQPATSVQPPEQPGLSDQPATSVQPPEQPGLSDQPATSVQPPEEPGFLDQPVTGYMTPASEVSQKPNTEKDIDPAFLVTGSSAGAGDDTEKLQETRTEKPENVPPLKRALRSLYVATLYLSKMLIATLPANVQPGPDFYGLPWQPVIVTAALGVLSFAIFFWRTILVVKSRGYAVSEQHIAMKLENMKKDNAELTQKLSDYEEKLNELKKNDQETKKQNINFSDEAVKYKDKIKILEETNKTLGDKVKSLHLMLESQREQSAKNERLILEKQKSLEKLKDAISINASELSEVQSALNEAKLSEENLKSEFHRVQEENARLKKKREQLQQQIEEWSKSNAELTEQLKTLEKSQKDLEVALTYKDGSVNALTKCITQVNQLECELESEGQDQGGKVSDELANGEVGGDGSEKIKNRIKDMMDVSRTQTAVSVVEEDLKVLQLNLSASVSTKCNLEDEIKKLEGDRISLKTAKAELEDECKTLKQKVEILNELYQQKEMTLQKKLSQEEYERQNKEQRLSAADEKVVLAAEEVKTYKRRIEEMGEELQKTERSFKSQIATNEKKAHDNWLKARAAERALAEEKREAANLRHRLLELSQKMAVSQDEPVIIKPMPGRPNTQNPPRRGLSQNGSFGPSPVSGGECSPPLPAELPGRPLSATLSRRDMPRSECGSLDRPLPRPRWPSEASGKHSASDPGPPPMMNSTSRSSSPAKAMDESKVNMAHKGPPPFPGVPVFGPPLGSPMPPHIRYGPPPQLCGPFGPRPVPPPFGMCPPPGIREYAPGVLPGKRDLPVDPREFLLGHTPFRPPGSLGPREYYIPGARPPPPPPPPTHGPQEYPLPQPAARDLLPSGPREEAPPASSSSDQACSLTSKSRP